MTLIGGGTLRDVFLVEYEGRQLALKSLRHVDELARQKVHLSMHRREVLTLDAVSGAVFFASGLCRNRFFSRVLVAPELFTFRKQHHHICWF